MNTETIVKQILEDVIGVQGLERDTRFLDVGGNSLNLVEILKQLKVRTGVVPSPRLFFDKEQSTIVGISRAIDALRSESLADSNVA